MTQPSTTSSSLLSRETFTRLFRDFHETQGTPLTRHPIVGGHKLDFYLLYTLIRHRGGFHKCAGTRESRAHSWRRIVEIYREKHPIPDSYTTLPYILRKRYKKYVLQFEVFLESQGKGIAIGQAGGGQGGGGGNGGRLSIVLDGSGSGSGPGSGSGSGSGLQLSSFGGGDGGGNDHFRVRKRKRTEIEDESCVVPFRKKRHLYRTDQQRRLVHQIECIFVAHVRDDNVKLQNFERVLWAVNAVFALSKSVTASPILPKKNPNEDNHFKVWLMDPLILTHDFPRIVQCCFENENSPGTKLERCALSCVSAIRNFVQVEPNAEFLSPSEDIFWFVLRGVKFSSAPVPAPTSDLRLTFLGHFLEILVKLAPLASFGNFSTGFQRRFFEETSSCLAGGRDRALSLEIMKSWVLLQTRNQALFEAFVDIHVWEFLVPYLSPYLCKPMDLMARSLVLDLFHSLVVESVVLSKRFKRSLLRLPGLVRGLIALIETKSGIDVDERSRFDDYCDDLVGREPECPRYPSDCLVLQAAKILKSCSRLCRKVLARGDLERIRVCQACVRDAEVCALLYTVSERTRHSSD